MLLKLISCGSLALVSVLVVAVLQGLRQHNQRIHALQERIDQLEERTPNRAHSELLSQSIQSLGKSSFLGVNGTKL